jgi:hypothetical protein
VILRLGDDGQWRDVYQASEGSDACPTTPLPTGVGVDLRACARPSKHTYLLSYFNGEALLKPRTLPHGAHSVRSRCGGSGGGRSVAAASGYLDYSDADTRFKAPIRLRASGVRFCGRKRIYRRLTLRLVRAADRRRYPHFEDSAAAGSCQSGSETEVFAPRARRP